MAIASLHELLNRIAPTRPEQSAHDATAGGFRPFFATCEVHGPYQANVLDDRGHERWFPGCQRCRQDARIRAMSGQATIPPRFHGKTLDNYHCQLPAQFAALTAAREMVAEIAAGERCSARNAVFIGRHGTGKSHLACAIARESMMAGRTALFISAGRAVQSVWTPPAGQTAQKVVDGFAAIDLLVLDDVGHRHLPEAARATVADLLGARHEAARPTLLTTNLPLTGPDYEPSLYACIGLRAYDRLWEDGCRVIVFDWPSSRGAVQFAPE